MTFLLKAAYLYIKWLAMQRWNVLFSRWIKSLHQFPTWQLSQMPLTPASGSLFFSLLPLVLVKIASNMTETQVSFQRAGGLRCKGMEKKSLRRVNVLICSKTIITMRHGRGFSGSMRRAGEFMNVRVHSHKKHLSL